MRVVTLAVVSLILSACSAGDGDPDAAGPGADGSTSVGGGSSGPAGGSGVASTTDDEPAGPTEGGDGTVGGGDDVDSDGDDSDDAGGSTTGEPSGPSGPFEPSCPEPDLDALPAWVPAPGSWGEISLNTMWDLNPCDNDPQCTWSANLGQSAVLTVWNGGAFACHEGELGSLVQWGGGHNGYWGNEVYVYDLASQTWERRSDPNPNPVVADPANGELDDGTPSVMHTYETLSYHPATNSFVVLQGQVVHNNASANGAGHMFSLTDNAWRRTAMIPGPGYGNSAYDAKRELFWGSAQFTRFYSFDPSGPADANGRYGTAVDYHHAGIGLDSVAAIDPNNDIFVVADLRDAPTIRVQDLTDPSSEFVVISTEGPMPSSGAGGFEWVSSRQRFYWYGENGNDIRTLEPPDNVGDGGLAGDWQSAAWQWTQLSPAGVGPQPRGNGTYGGWAWAPSIQSFVIVNDVQDAVFAYRPE
ncbi:MAG: hypothetical protein AAF721_12860 [Myxococcota bacterium]